LKGELEKHMYDEKKIALIKKLGTIAVCVLILIAGFATGFGVGSSKKKAAAEPEKPKVEEVKKELTAETVNKFLIAYYTKKDLGENRNRYEPLVTTAMYNELTTEEEQPVNQAYKGYVVNQVLDSAEIYVNTEDSSAICVVTYKNTQRMKQGTDDGALLNQSNQEAIKLTFLQQGKQYLVNQVSSVIVENSLINNRNSYNTAVETTAEEIESSEAVTTQDTTAATENYPENGKFQEQETEESLNESSESQ
jgi:hypothetical protein